MQGVRRARPGTRIILRAGVSHDLKVVRRLDHEAALGYWHVPIEGCGPQDRRLCNRDIPKTRTWPTAKPAVHEIKREPLRPPSCLRARAVVSRKHACGLSGIPHLGVII